MLAKLAKSFNLLRQDLTALKSDMQRIEKVRQVVRNGKDGVSPDPEEIVSAVLGKIPPPKDGVSPDPQTIAVAAAKLVPLPKPGRDAIPPTIRDVADVVLAKIEKPKDGVSPDPKTIAIEAAKLVPRPKDGVSPTPEAVAKNMPNPQRGKTGAPGKNGVSVTDVQLNNNELFVFLDGKKNSAGKIKMLAASAPFRPGADGGGGSARQLDPAIAIKNREIINKTGDWPEAVNGYVDLEPFTEYRIGSNDVELPSKWRVTGPTLISGGTGVSSVKYNGGGALLNAIDFGRLVVKDLDLDFPNAEFLAVEDATNPTTSIVNLINVVVLSGAGAGSYKNILGLTISLCSFSNITQGFRDTGLTTAVLSVSQATGASTNPGFRFFDLGDNVYSSFEVSNARAIGPVGSFTFTGLPDSGNIADPQIGKIDSCETLGGVELLEFITPDDVGYDFLDSGVINSGPVGHTYVVTPALTDVLDGTDVQIEGTFAQGSESSQSTSDVGGTITMLNRVEQRGTAVVNVDMTKASGAASDYLVKIRKKLSGAGSFVDVDGAFGSTTLAGGGSSSLPIKAPVRYKAGDEYIVTVRGVGTAEDITATTTGFTIA